MNSAQNEVLICRGCLNIEERMFNINTSGLTTTFSTLIGLQMAQYDGMPLYLCHICCALVKKFTRFKEKCINSNRILENVQSNCISVIDIKKINLHQNIYQHTKTEIYDYQPDKINENKYDIHSPIYDINVKHDETNIKNEDTNFDQKSDKVGCDLSFNNDDIDIKSDNDTDSDKALATFKNKKIKTKHTLVKNKHDKSDSAKISQIGHKSESAKICQKVTKFRRDNLDVFEEMFNVEIIVLSKEEQYNDVLNRKMGQNYLHSPFKCELCFRGYMDEDSLKKHHMAHHDASRSPVVCEFCKFRYNDRRGLNQHLKKHRLKFTCRQCKYVSRTTFNAKEHNKMHTGQIYECKQCGKSYEKLSSYLSHMRIHHPSELVWCECCGEAFIGEFGLNGHKKRAHRDLTFPPEALCTRCNTNITSLEALNKHTSKQTNTCDAACVHCGAGFDSRLQLKDHLKVHRSRKKYSCEKCSKSFTKESLYSAHYKRIHTDSNDTIKNNTRNWICENCGKSLPSKCLLVYHQRNHTGERPYQCAECPKGFTMKKLLQSHMRVHTNSRPYSCKVCPKTFKSLSALRAHGNVHEVKTNFKN